MEPGNRKSHTGKPVCAGGLIPGFVSSKWVEEEFLYASELNKKIVPLFYRQCSLPFGYRTLHFINVQGVNYKRNFNEILRTLGVKPVVPGKPSVPVREELSTVTPEEKPKVVPGPEPKKANLKVNPRAVVGLFGLAAIVVAGIFGFPYMAEKLSNQPEATATATWTARPFNATEAAFVTRVAPSPAPQTATSSALLTKVAIGDTQIAAEPQLLNEITDEFGVEMVLVPGGEFIMGDDGEQSTIFLDSFYIDKFEVTNALYRECVKSGPCNGPTDTILASVSYFGNDEYSNYPVVWVTQPMAKTFCNWRDARLPNSQEWEKAARGTDGRIYPWGNSLNSDTLANSRGVIDGYELTSPVGQFLSDVSPYGAFDMGGNVSEFVDNYASYSWDDINYPVFRGGSWLYHSLNVTSSGIAWKYHSSDSEVGFRCARDATP